MLKEASNFAQNHRSAPITLDSKVHPKSNVQFVFFIGLKGTGHHLLEQIVRGSPTLTLLKTLRIHPITTWDFHTVLFQAYSKNGLWNAHTHPEADKLNITQIQDRVVYFMQKINRKATRNNCTITFPVNTLNGREGPVYGEVSYPNFFGECRAASYPNLDVFYDSCDKAGADCRHVYLYRDPYQIISSTTRKRKFNPNVLNAIHMYTSHLKIIASDLQVHSSRTLGCFGFFMHFMWMIGGNQIERCTVGKTEKTFLNS